MREPCGLHRGRVYGVRGPSRVKVNEPHPYKRNVHELPPVREYGPMRRILFGAILLMVVGAPCWAQKRLVLVDQDGSGPGGSNQMAMMVLLQSPQVEILGITMVTGNAWRDEEARHTLRMLELIGRSDVPVVPGAVFPLVRTEEETRIASQLGGRWCGKALGAWADDIRPKQARRDRIDGESNAPGPGISRHARGRATPKPLEKDAAHF